MGVFSDWCWYSGFGGSVVRTPLLHSDVMRLRRSVQLVLILITCKKTKIHKMDIQKTYNFFQIPLMSLKQDQLASKDITQNY